MLRDSGWETRPCLIAEQHYFTDGRIVLAGRSAKRRQGKRADYILRYTRDLPLAVVEAKAENVPAGEGMQQAREYAIILGLHFAYATNGRTILEWDAFTGLETNTLRPSIVASGLDPANLPTDMAPERARALYGSGGSTGVKRWADIWSAGHSVSGVDAVQSVADLVARTRSEYRRAAEAARTLVIGVPALAPIG